MNKIYISVILFLLYTHVNFAIQESQQFKQSFFSKPKLYDDYIYGFNQEKQFSLYSIIGDFIYSFKDTNFNPESQKIYFNKLFLLDDNNHLSVFDIKSQQKYYTIDDINVSKYIISSSYLCDFHLS